MKNYLYYILLLSLLMTGYATFSQQDSRADRYLQAVSDQFDMNEGYRIKVDYIRRDIMRETSAEGEGTIWMKGLKYKMEVNEYIVYFDGEKQYSQNTDAQEVYVSTPDPEQPGYLQAVPIRILKSYRDFKYQLIGSSTFMGKERIEVQLYPKDMTGPYSMLKLFIQPQTLILKGIQLKHKEGIEYTMILSEIEGNQQFDDSMFTFDPSKYPDTEVIELVE
ncbi:MAG: LolA family protein [Bacteroidales bacterium]